MCLKTDVHFSSSFHLVVSMLGWRTLLLAKHEWYYTGCVYTCFFFRLSHQGWYKSYTWVLAARIWRSGGLQPSSPRGCPIQVVESQVLFGGQVRKYSVLVKKKHLQLSTRWWHLSFHHHTKIFIAFFACVLLWNSLIGQVKQNLSCCFSLKYHGTASLQKLIQNLPFPFPPRQVMKGVKHFTEKTEQLRHGPNPMGLAARSGAPPEVPIQWQSVIHPKIWWSHQNEVEHEMIFFGSDIK